MRRGCNAISRRLPASPRQVPEWFVKQVTAVAGDPVPSCVLEAHMDTAWTVPAGHIAVLGDAPRTRDSRHFGLVPSSAVLRVACRTWRDQGTA